MDLPATPAYEHNLAALAQRQPAVAEQVQAAGMPPGVTHAVGRDGEPAYRLANAQGHSVWQGGTSLPRVSAEALAQRVHRTGVNLLIPRALTGWEAAAVLRRLPSPTAVFVAETDARLLKLALHGPDLSAGIAAGRMVFLLGEDVESALRRFFASQPGYDVPRRLMRIPHLTPAELADWQRRLESLFAEIEPARLSKCHELAQQLAEAPAGAAGDRPSVAVVSLSAQPSALAHLGRLERALAALDWPAAVCGPDRPEHVHAVSRVSAVARAKAAWVLAVDSGPEAVRPFLAAELPVVCAYLPGSLASPRPKPADLGPRDVVCDSVIAEAASLEGPRWEPAADATLAQRVADAAAHGERSPGHIAIVADIPATAPESAGLYMASHQAVWQALQERLGERLDEYTDQRAEEWLDAAQRQLGISLSEAAQRAHLLAGLRLRLAPAARAQAALAALTGRSDAGVTLWGANWRPGAGDRAVWQGGWPHDEPALAQLVQGSRLVVFPLATALAVQTALDVLLAGRPVVCASPRGGWAAVYPGLADLVPDLNPYRTRPELASVVDRLAADPAFAAQQVANAQAGIRAAHTVAHRLRRLHDEVTAGQRQGVGITVEVR